MKKMKCRFLYITAELVLLFIFAFVGNPVSVFAQASKSSSKKATDQKTVVAEPKATAPADELDAAIRETSDYLNKQLPKGNKLMILNVQSDFPALSEYIIDELTANTVNDRIFSVVDRQQLNTIRAELNFQMSGEVDDATAQSLGRMAGAQIIISGAVSKIGDLYRLRIRALSVQSAQIEGQFNRNIPSGPTIIALVNSKATGYGNTTVQTNTTPAKATTASTGTGQASTSAPATTQATAPTIPTTYKIGDKGPGGGIIFYVSTAGFNLTADNTICHYLEAAPTDLGSMTWASSEAMSTNIAGLAISVGAGKRNTNLILTADPNAPAANTCKDYAGGGKNDWFLPSIGELTQLFNNRDVVGGFVSYASYWSSNQSNRDVALCFDFNNSRQLDKGKGYQFCVRPIRAF